MENLRTPDLHPSTLPSGTLVGNWRVVGRRGLGVYGAVYCAVKVGQEQAGLVAIKIAVHEGDLRFQREVALLSRTRHPNVPPPALEPRDDDEGRWYVPAFHPRPPQERNARVAPRLSALILRMLGSEQSTEDAFEDSPLGYPRRRRVVEVVRAAEQHEAMARAAAARLEAEMPSRLPHSQRPSPTVRLWVGLAGLGLLVLALTRQRVDRRGAEAVPSVAGVETSTGDTPDAGTAGVGETALTSAISTSLLIPTRRGIRLDMPPQPFPWQRLPPCGRGEVEIRGGCWVQLAARAPECDDYAYVWKGGCYKPTADPPRPSTSNDP